MTLASEGNQDIRSKESSGFPDPLNVCTGTAKYSQPRNLMPYTPLFIANQIIKEANRQGIELGMVRLQKLLFFADGHYLAEHGHKLIDGGFEAWKFGPVSRPVYREFKPQMSSAIVGGDDHVLFPIDRKSLWGEEFRFVTDKRAKKLLERVVSHYAVQPAFDLVELSHDPQGPWHSIWSREKIEKLSEDETRRFFSQNPLPIF